MSVGKEVAPGLDSGVEHDVGQQRGVRSQPHLRAHHHIRANMRSFADFGCGIDDRRGMDAGGISRRLIEKSQSPGEGQVRVPEPQGRYGNLLKIRIDKHGRSPRFFGQRGISRVGHEGYLSGASLLNSVYARYFQLRVSAQLRSQPDCQFA